MKAPSKPAIKGCSKRAKMKFSWSVLSGQDLVFGQFEFDSRSMVRAEPFDEYDDVFIEKHRRPRGIQDAAHDELLTRRGAVAMIEDNGVETEFRAPPHPVVFDQIGRAHV